MGFQAINGLDFFIASIHFKRGLVSLRKIHYERESIRNSWSKLLRMDWFLQP